MVNIEQNISNNIVKLRKINNLTQLELANKLQYSDKSISKWERGESLPDITVLNTIAELFGVTVDYLLKPHADDEFVNQDKDKKQEFWSKLLVAILWCVGAFSVSIVIFIYVHLMKSPYADKFWVSFVCANAVSCFILSIYARRQKFEVLKLVMNSLLMWSVICSTFCIALVNDFQNVWMFFLVGIPIQAALCLSFFMKKIK